MKIGIILQSSYLDNETDKEGIISAIKKLSIPLNVVDYNFSSFDKKKWEGESVDAVTCFGSISFNKRFPNQFIGDQIMHNLFASDLHNYSKYQYKINRNFILNKNGIILPFSEIYEQKNTLNKNFKEEVFIRPDNALKICEAELVNLNNINDWIERSKSLNLISKETLFWLFEKQNIKKEFRTLVVNNKMITASKYIDNGEIIQEKEESEELRHFVELAAKEISLEDQCYVMDIAETDNGFKVIEINCAASSGLYLMDKTKYFSNCISYINNYLEN